jgi:ribosomal protein L2
MPTGRTYSQATTPFPPQSSKSAEQAPSESRKPEAFALRRYKPITPGLRHLVRPINDHLWKGKPWKPLTYPKKGQGRGGRNNTGHVTVRHRGGGHARRIRTVDFTRTRGGKQIVDRIEYDPNRSAHIALVTHRGSQEKSYILAADGLREGDEVESFRSGLSEALMRSMGGTIDPGMLAARTTARGNCLPLYMIPIGTSVFNVGLKKKEKGILCRSAGTFATIVAKDNEGSNSGKLSGGKFVTVRLQSGEIRKISSEACATIGVASNPDYHHRQLGKAGRSRWLGIRPTVRGVAMNACKSSCSVPASSPNMIFLDSRSSPRRWPRQVKRKCTSR